MHIGRYNGIVADKAMVDINADTALVSVLIDAFLFDPVNI